MGNVTYKLQFEKLSDVLELGELIDKPEVISGGLLHRMYKLKTRKGMYAVKALNPQIMIRKMAMQHFIDSEKIVSRLSKSIPALPAKRFNDVFVIEIDSQFYLVFDWVEGQSLKADEIKKFHCEKIGAILAEIHSIDLSYLGIKKESPDELAITDWRYYLDKGKESSVVWVNPFGEILNKLYQWNREANEASNKLKANVVISHRDLDSKNVMWDNGNPILIDWESAGYINPMQDLIETALYWSEKEDGSLDEERFIAFIGGYKNKYGILNTNWTTVLQSGFSGKLGWLEYNLKRSLMIECNDEKEQEMGIAEVVGTLEAIKRYAEMIPTIKKLLEVNCSYK